MWSLFNISDSPSLTLYDLEKGVREANKNIIPTFMIQATVEPTFRNHWTFLPCLYNIVESPPQSGVSVWGSFWLSAGREWSLPLHQGQAWSCHIVTYSNTKSFDKVTFKNGVDEAEESERLDEEESKNIDKDDSNSSVKDKDVLSETKATTSKVEEQLEFVEFQLFLQYLRQYFLYCQVVFEVIMSRSQ